MSLLRRREVSGYLLFIVSMIFIVQYYLPGFDPLDSMISILGNWSVIFSAIAMGLGLINLAMHSVKKIQKRGKEWYFDAWLLFIMLLIVVLGGIGGIKNESYLWIFNNIYQQLSPTFFGFAYLYMCSVAVLSFRVKNWDSALLMIGGILIMVGNIPFVQVYTGAFVSMKDWIFAVPARGVFTAFRISMALGFVLIGIRTLLGIERGYLGAEET